MISLLIGLAAGFFGGLVGLGGGVIMIPLMVSILKMGQHKAHGTSLVALVFTGISGAVTYALNGSVDILASVLLASTAIFTARAGAHFANALPEWKLKRSFGGFLILVSLLLLLKPYLPHVCRHITGWLETLILLLTGIFTGFLSGMMGVGGGTIMVPSMVLLTGFTQYTAQGCSLLAMVPVGTAGAYTHWRLGNVSASILPGLVPGILIGTYLGGSLAHILSEGALRIIFSAVLIWTGVRYLRTPKPQAGEVNYS
ncbi:putative membrane protein YfcA [Desulfofundulus luciae]|uniref:Probable membrane transporter protein n=1 Tax=Desulfofundulus luciae TaxID=74702 RepID=A0ABU0B2W2_9FIRM|nr:sulfite exporter TauE/SafE family protein [Desulfofundulus luciae]MDQ0287060.1 putative membrane protein YfcA [Desulfofundulus luciae]